MKLYIAGADGIGYNQEEVNNLCSSLDGALTGVKQAIEEGFNAMTAKFRDAWKGEDEAGFESTFKDEVIKMYQNMDSVIISAETFIVDAANAWAEWQSNASQQFGGASVQPLEQPQHVTEEINIQLTEQSFDRNTDRGLQSEGAENQLTDAVTEFMNNIKTKTDNLNEGIETSKAFIGSEQANAMSQFIEGVQSALGELTGMVNNFNEHTIPELAAAYKSQRATVAQDASKAQQTVADSVDGAIGGA